MNQGLVSIYGFHSLPKQNKQTYAIEFVVPKMSFLSRLSPAQCSLTMVCPVSVIHIIRPIMNYKPLTRKTGPDPGANLTHTALLSIPFLSVLWLKHLPSKIKRGPFEAEWHSIPDCQVHSRKEADRERKIDDGCPDL